MSILFSSAIKEKKGVSLLHNNNYAAAASNNGKVYLWNNQDGSLILSEEFTEALEDIVFSQDNTKLWAISGYIEIIEFDIQNKKRNSFFLMKNGLLLIHGMHINI